MMMTLMMMMLMMVLMTLMLTMMVMPRWANIFLFFSVLFTLFLASNVIVLKVRFIIIIIVNLPQMVLANDDHSHLPLVRYFPVGSHRLSIVS